ncbi:hypothetical protein OROHE_024980 [Orobanche hederae]
MDLVLSSLSVRGNVLLLRKQLILSSDIGEVSQKELLSLVTNLLNCSNSNVNYKDAGYVENQRKDIADAIDLLPSLATGMNINLRFMRIDDFEFTPERAIFDLLKIPLCHGWIVDQQDHDTAIAIGSKSYDALLEELVSLGPLNIEIIPKKKTVLILLLQQLLLLECLLPVSRKGDLEEEEELSRALEISKVDFKSSISGGVSFGMDENMCDKQAVYEGKEEITPEQGQRTGQQFLRNNASRLTSYGLSCLRDGLEELQLCVFFRNNHFSTMFKFEGELYLLVTDQGYINQPDLVWGKLNEDCLGSIDDGATQAALDINSGLQSSIALQQQEVGSRLVRDWQNDSAVCSRPHETGGKLPFLPEELIKKTLLYVQVRDLLRFKSVCKSWKTWISCSQFTHNQYLISTSTVVFPRIVTRTPVSPQFQRYIHTGRLIIYPDYHRKRPSIPSVSSFRLEPIFNKQLDDFVFDNLGPSEGYMIQAVCNGLVLLSNLFYGTYNKKTHFMLWNPFTGSKSNPYAFRFPYDIIPYGFGYDQCKDKYKLFVVGIIKVFPESPLDFILFGKLHWLLAEDPEHISTFDLEKETYGKMSLPHGGLMLPSLYLFNNLLHLLSLEDDLYSVWKMGKYGVHDSWTRFIKIPFEKIEFYSPRRPRLLYISEKGVALMTGRDERKIPKAFLYNSNNRRVHCLPRSLSRFTKDDFRFIHIYHESIVSPPQGPRLQSVSDQGDSKTSEIPTYAVLNTTKGSIVVQLYKESADAAIFVEYYLKSLF